MRKAFAGFSFYGLLLSDQDRHHWQFMPILNPDSKSPQGVSWADLPTDEPIDPIIHELGTDVSVSVSHDERLYEIVAGEADSLYLHEEPDISVMTSMFGVKAKTLYGARWERPRGGIGWIILGYTEPREFDEHTLSLFETFVRITARMAIYPEMVHEVARTERMGMSLRRNIVHDLKTPVTVIRGYAQTMLIPGVVDSPQTQRELLTGIIEQADRLLDDLKDILVPLDDAWRPQPEEFDLAIVLQQAIIAERHTERAQNHRIQLEGTDKPCRVYVDRRKIRRVLENLVSNAVKFSPGSGKTVTVILEDDGTEVKITFMDEGIGMTEEQLNRVLREGGRAVDRTLGIEGSGFGLDSCRKVLEAQDGALDAESEPGKGSKFTARFPKRLRI
ncbi:MAG TPA: HAMP domain-containing sensor histidine kinase [Fimbriimonadaceae bacterium]|nr:HAMP domain-containing sensor histidine kinase [Fimbriimonadaceae bacterium]